MKSTSTAELKKRWETPEGKKAVNKIIKRFKKGKVPDEVNIYGEHDGLLDLRGIPLSSGDFIEKIKLIKVDMSYCDLEDVWIEKTTFENVNFTGSNLNDISDHGNKYVNVQFNKTDLRNAAIGYDGTKFLGCTFDRCLFNNAIFIRAEFDDCLFRSKLKGIDFDVSSFRNCTFEGELDDVWFRGDYPVKSDIKEFGKFRKNNMEGVDFSKARLSYLTVTDGVPLSGVKLPEDPLVFYLDKLNETLPLAKKIAVEKFKGRELSEVVLFFKVLSHYDFNEQPEDIFTLRDLIEDGNSEEFALKLKDILLYARKKID